MYFETIDLSYDLAGRLTGTTRPNGTSSTYSYDAAGRLAGLLHSLGVSDFLDLGFGYDAAGNITAITELGEVRSFGYDDLNRLVTAGTAALPESYGYDPAGNRTVSHRSNSHSHDDANRLLEDQQFLYLYDLNGNLTAKTDKATSDLTSYSYDAQNQLTRIDFPGGGYAEYKYDGLGRRIEKDVDGTITRYVYDGTDIVMTFDDLGVLQARVNHGDRVDQPLFMARGGQATYYHGDHLGSVRALSDASGAVVNSYAYDAFGNTTAASETVANPYRFTAREFDAESGLSYHRARYYDGNAGRFITRDPIGLAGGDQNLYSYVFNDPVNLTDPSGTVAAVGSALFNRAGQAVIGRAIRLPSAADAAGALIGAAKAAGRAYRSYQDLAQSVGTTEANAVLINVIGSAVSMGDAGDEKADNAADTSQTSSTAAETASGTEVCDTSDPNGDGEDDDENGGDGDKEPPRTEPESLEEKLAMDEAGDPEDRTIMKDKIKDPRYPEDKFDKKSHIHKNPDGSQTEIHYWKNLETGEISGKKFK